MSLRQQGQLAPAANPVRFREREGWQRPCIASIVYLELFWEGWMSAAVRGARAATSVPLTPSTLLRGLDALLGRCFRRPVNRAVRRRRVARAYDMAAEIARYLRVGDRVLDVGCGNGFIAHHLSALVETPVLGVDLHESPQAPIAYQRFDGRRLPFGAGGFDALLLCYVLHHSADPAGLIVEAARVLRPGAMLVVYEDIPATIVDKLLCWRHERAWRLRSGPCSFQLPTAWQGLFCALGFEEVEQRTLSRLRDINNPVRRAFFVMRRFPERVRESGR